MENQTNITIAEKVLSLQATELENYIKCKHKIDECNGWIDGFERACLLFKIEQLKQGSQIKEATQIINDFIAFFRPVIDGRYENEQEKILKMAKDYQTKYLKP